MPDTYILTPILMPLATAFLLPFAGLLSRRLLPLLCIFAEAVSLVALALAIGPVFFQNEVLVYWLGGWQPKPGMAIGIDLAVDSWGLFIAFIIALVGFLSLLYSVVYLEEETGKEAYYVLMMLMIAAMTGFVLTGDLFNQFVWLEILSFSAFALTAFHYQQRSAVEGAFKYFVTNSLGALFILVALAVLYATTGALNLANAAGEFGKISGEMVALGLLFAGFAIKTAIVPWHFWLPDAYDAAPAPVAAVFSGALSKIGIYAIGRLLFTLTPSQFNFSVREIFLVISALTMVVGGFQMLRQEFDQAHPGLFFDLPDGVYPDGLVDRDAACRRGGLRAYPQSRAGETGPVLWRRIAANLRRGHAPVARQRLDPENAGDLWTHGSRRAELERHTAHDWLRQQIHAGKIYPGLWSLVADLLRGAGQHIYIRRHRAPALAGIFHARPGNGKGERGTLPQPCYDAPAGNLHDAGAGHFDRAGRHFPRKPNAMVRLALGSRAAATGALCGQHHQ